MEVRQQLYDRLKAVARAGEKTTYGAIAPMLGLDLRSEADRAEMGRILGDIAQKEHEEGRPMLSAVVVNASSGRPSKGFFNKARYLGLYHGGDDVGFFERELKRVHEYWASR